MQNPSLRQSYRREFMKPGAMVTAATLLPGIASAQDAADKEIKVALIGCGGRETGAASQSLTVPGTTLVAMADAFEDNLTKPADALQKQFKDRVEVPAGRRFVGFDAYKKAIDAANLVLLCSSPGSRPMHFEYAVQQGKHVFMEKPVAVD